MNTTNGKDPAIINPIAKEIGLNEYLLIKQIQIIVEHNRTNNQYFYDGEYWACISFTDLLNDYFPFWSTSTLKRTMTSLRDRGLIIMGEGNTNRTNCYRVDTERIFHIMENSFATDTNNNMTSQTSVASQTPTIKLTIAEEIQFNKEYDAENQRVILMVNKLNMNPFDKAQHIEKHMEQFAIKLRQKYSNTRNKK